MNDALKKFYDETRINPPKKTTQTLVKVLGGSRGYGLHTEKSDYDWRGVYYDLKFANIAGLDRGKSKVDTDNGKDDTVLYEVRDFLNLLRKGNTGAMEILWTDDAAEYHPEYWPMIKGSKDYLCDPEKLFSCLRAYIQGELGLANGTRTGKLGGQRQEAVAKYGFSPKNFVQLFRLAMCGITYFSTGVFPVNIMSYSSTFGRELLDLKLHPENYNKESLNVKAQKLEEQLVDAYESRDKYLGSAFDESIANAILLKIYGSVITNLYNNRYPQRAL